MMNVKNKVLVSLVAALAIISPQIIHANNRGDYIKDAIDRVADSLKKAVDDVGDDIVAAQQYLDNYHWKGILQDSASSGMATLSDMKLNGHKRAVVVKPGERIEGEVICALDPAKCDPISFYRVVIGIHQLGGQTSVGNCLGSVAGKDLEKFVLIAPKDPGVYQIRFRPTTALLERSALEDWKDKNGNEPDGTTTVGLILVK